MTEKATCSVCKLPVRVKKNGTLYRHINPYPVTGPWSEYCPGGSRPPMLPDLNLEVDRQINEVTK